MRTRDEQIIQSAQYLISMRSSGKCTEYDFVTCIVEEAERRAEQRVRAEIARDSERLDWLLTHSHYGIPGFDPVVSGRTPEKRRADLIRAIDAAREAR